MSRFFVPIAVGELKEKIDAALAEDGYDYRHLTPVIKKDLDKVDFSIENIEVNGSVEDLVGYYMLSNGMPILGISSGGDWEYPMFFCIYFDGKKLRAYIPEKGNTWNTDTKKAYGNDTVADLKNARKRWPVQYPPCSNYSILNSDLEVDEDEDVEPIGNTDEMAKDIMDRILKKAEPQKNVVVKLTLEPVAGAGWDRNAIETLIKASNGCNIPGLGNVYQGTRVIAQIIKVEIK